LYNTNQNGRTSDHQGSLPPLSHLNQQDHHHQSPYPSANLSQHPNNGVSRDPSNPIIIMPDLGSQALQSNAGGGIGPIRGSPEIAVQQDHTSTPSNRSFSQSSASSDMLAVTLQTETLDMIQNIVKVCPCKTPELLGSDPLKSFIGIMVRQILLEPKLDQYSRGDSKTKKGPNAKTPYTLVKEALDTQDSQWLAQNLSVQWRDNTNDVEKVNKIIGAKLKANKNSLVVIIKENLDSTPAVEPLDQLVTQVYGQLTLRFKDARGKKIMNDQHITKPVKARLGYLRFQIHLNNLLIIKNKGTKITTPSFWNQIDKDLAYRSCKTEAYQFAFTNLVFLKDRKVCKGQKRASDITAEEAALPTEEEIKAELQRLNSNQL
ncbi:hypothetical protein PSHT_01825, partial [Puccinia striiformis]